MQILTLEPWKGTHFLLRLEHILEENDDDSASTAVTVNLNVNTRPIVLIILTFLSAFCDTWIKLTCFRLGQYIKMV